VNGVLPRCARVVGAAQDETLRSAVTKYEGKSWKKIASCLPGRTDVQCLHRWQKVLKPGLVKGPWTAEVRRSRLLHAVLRLVCAPRIVAARLSRSSVVAMAAGGPTPPSPRGAVRLQEVVAHRVLLARSPRQAVS
jgi:hypothetical protein